MKSSMNQRAIPQKCIFDLVTLTLELDRDIFPLDLHAEILVHVSVRQGEW